MGWKIRFYSGLNKGAETRLEEGRVVIGADPAQADLVLVDPGIGDVHLVLMVEQEGVRLVEWTGSEPPRQGGMAVEAGSVLQAAVAQRCGPLLWAYCDEQVLFPEQLPESVPSAGTQGGERKTPLKALLVIGAGVLGTIAMLAWLLLPWSTAQGEGEVESPQKLLQAFLQAQQLPPLQVAPQEEGAAMVVSGYLPRNDQRQQVQQYLESRGAVFRLEVRTMEELRNDVDFILRRLGYAQLHSVDGPRLGWLRLVGEDIDPPERWNQLEQLLKADVPGLQGVELQAQAKAAPLDHLRKLLGEQGLGNALTVEARGDALVLQGELDERQQRGYLEVQRQFRQAYGDGPALKLLERARAAEAPKLDFNIRSVSVGRVPYVTLTDNQRYPVGGMTPTGIRIQAISAQTITLSKGGQQYRINLKEGLSDAR